jgi:hypothetical protein
MTLQITQDDIPEDGLFIYHDCGRVRLLQNTNRFMFFAVRGIAQVFPTN